MEITIKDKNKIKERLYFTYIFYKKGFDLNDKFEETIIKDYKKYMNSKRIRNYTFPNLQIQKFELQNRLLLMSISLLCEMFEQFLGSIIFSNFKLEKGLDFNNIKKNFKENGYNLEDNSHWNKINELRLLVNVIKHGDGYSRKQLQNIRPDFFDHKDIIKNTLNDVELNVWDNDLDDYFIELTKFIDEIPNKI